MKIGKCNIVYCMNYSKWRQHAKSFSYSKVDIDFCQFVHSLLYFQNQNQIQIQIELHIKYTYIIIMCNVHAHSTLSNDNF